MNGRPVRAVTVFGSINIDHVFRVSKFPQGGETIQAKSVAKHPGGKGANQALAAARAGARVRFIGRRGGDSDADLLVAGLEYSGVDCSDVTIDQNLATGTAYILVDDSGENQIVISPGANGAASAPSPSDGVLLAQLELSLETVATFLSGRISGSTAILNAAPFQPDARKLFAYADIIVVNETELSSYAAATGVPNAASEVSALAGTLLSTQAQTIIVTRGRRGSVTVTQDGFYETTSPLAQVVDTTGAGDCFCGFLAAGIAAGHALEVSIRRAHVAAGISVGRRGAAASIPSSDEVDA